MTRKSLPLLIGLAMIGLSGHAADKFDVSKLDFSKLPQASTRKGLTYAKDVRPILESTCFRCHGEEQQKGQLRLDSREALLKGGKHGSAIVPGKSQESHLVIAASQIDDETAMPPKRRPGGRGGAGGPGGLGGGAGAPGGAGGSRPGGAGRPGGSSAQTAAAVPGAPGGPGRPGGAGGPGGGGPPAKPLTAEQVGIIRAWIEQGGK